VVDHRAIHGSEDPVRAIGWTRNLQEMTPSVNH